MQVQPPMLTVVITVQTQLNIRVADAPQSRSHKSGPTGSSLLNPRVHVAIRVLGRHTLNPQLGSCSSNRLNMQCTPKVGQCTV